MSLREILADARARVSIVFSCLSNRCVSSAGIGPGAEGAIWPRPAQVAYRMAASWNSIASTSIPLRPRAALARVGGAGQPVGRDQDRVGRAEGRGRDETMTLLLEQAHRVGR